MTSAPAAVARSRRGRLPTNDEGFAILLRLPYLTAMPVDAWGRPHLYAIPGRAGDYDIYTLGADGRPGGDGDDADIASGWGTLSSRHADPAPILTAQHECAYTRMK